MNHIEVGKFESSSLNPTDCERWLSEVEKLLGHSLDGNKDEDGYSLDSAVEAFFNGVWQSPEEYAKAIENAKQSPCQ